MSRSKGSKSRRHRGGNPTAPAPRKGSPATVDSNGGRAAARAAGRSGPRDRAARAARPTPRPPAHDPAWDLEDTPASARVAPPPLRTLVRWTLVGMFILAVAVGAGYGLSVAQDPVYGAETDVLYRVPESSGARAERDLATQQVIAQGRSVLQPVAGDAGMPVEELQEIVSVEIVGQSDVLRITMAHPDPDRAVDLAQAVADRYVRTVTEGPVADPEAATLVEAAIEDLATELAAVEEELAAVEDEPTGPATAAEGERLRAEAADLQARIDGLERLLSGSTIAPGGAEVRVLTPAYLLEEPLAPQPLRAAMAGGIGGLLAVGALGAVLARRWGYV